MGAKFCENCGGKLDEGAKFCPACGKNVGSSSTPSDPMPTPMPVPQKKKKSKLKIAGGILAALILLMFLVSMGSNSGSSGKSGGISSSKVIQIKAEEMAKDYMDDPDAAQTKYKDKDVEVTGKLVSKGQFGNTQDFGLAIYHQKENGKDYAVILDLTTDEVETANKIKEGDFVKAKGKCVGTVKQDKDNVVSIQIHAEKVNK